MTPSLYPQIVDAMMNCLQTEGQTIWEHGHAVANKYRWLQSYLYGIRKEDELPFPLPDWVRDNKEFLTKHTFREFIMVTYLQFHDCGKPFCITFDEEGRRHFPNHAEVSYDIWKTFTKPTYENELIGELIRNDMFFHITKPSDEQAIKEMAKRRIAIPLLLAAFCEIHANAEMFGGYQSTSFKIKQKRLNKLATKLLGEINNEQA